MVPHMELHDNAEGRYFGREIAFLSMLEVGWEYEKCEHSAFEYHIKRV
jgi:hypothetical protein